MTKRDRKSGEWRLPAPESRKVRKALDPPEVFTPKEREAIPLWLILVGGAMFALGMFLYVLPLLASR